MDVDKLLAEISPDQPCGEDLEYDPAFGEMERASQGKPEQQMGDSIVPAEDPDWRQVGKLAQELFSRTKDLRVAVYLTRAAAATEGMNGLRDGLTVLDGLIERYWDDVHPRLDPEDGNDPTMRVNIIASLCDGDVFLPTVREAPLVRSRGLGTFSFRDVQVATGQMPAPSGGEPPNPATIDAAFLDCDVDELSATADAVTQAAERIGSVETRLTERVGTANAADLSALGDLLRGVQATLGERLGRRGVVGASPAAAAGTPVGAAAPAAAGNASAASAPLSGEVNSREDAMRALDKICDYFMRHEPSSPVPLLLQRAKRLVSKSFMDIVRDLAPDGVSQVEVFRGSEGGSGESDQGE